MKAWLFKHIEKEVSIAPLVVFRVVFGLVMLIGTIRFWLNDWIDTLYIQPDFFFPYYGFEWVKPLSGNGMYLVFLVVGISSLCIALGFLYRLSALIFFLSFTYVELLDKTNYLNHYYFVSLIAFLLIFVPAGASFSLDALIRKTSQKTVRAWCINIFKLQMGILYFYAGIAKLNADWLFDAMPLKLWLAPHTGIWLIGPLMDKKLTAYVFSWAGMLFDISIPFILLNNRLRLFGYVAVVVFHLLTSIFFQIGMFPYVMIGVTLIFFSEEFHQSLLTTLKRFLNFKNNTLLHQTTKLYNPVRMRLLIGVLTAFFMIQLLFPFRYLLYPGKLFWTEEGFRFSWRVMLMEKVGFAEFFVKDETTGKTWIVSNCDYLTPQQEKMMSTQPDMILQYAHLLKQEAIARHNMEQPKVFAEVFVSLNGRRSRPFVDSSVDLGAQAESFAHKTWILPFE